MSLNLIKLVPKPLVKPAKNMIFKLSKHRPEIQLAGGVVLIVGGFVYGIVQTRKLDDVMERSESRVKAVEAKKDIIDQDGNPVITEKEYKKDLTVARAKGVWDMVKLYGPPVLALSTGLIFIVNGHFVMVRRNAALATLAAGWEKAYKLYDQRVVKELGEEQAKKYRDGIVDCKDIVAMTKDGVEYARNAVPVVDRNASYHPYRFVYSQEFAQGATGNPIIDMAFLRCQEEYWGHEYTGQDRITLMEVIKSIGIRIDKNDPMYDDALIAGWDHRKTGDDMIKFGLLDAINEPAIKNQSDVIYITFNCDGNLYGYDG